MVGEIEYLLRGDISIIVDHDGDNSFRLEIPRSKSDHCNKCHVRVLKSSDFDLEQEDAQVFSGNVRKALESALKLVAACHNVGHTRISNHSVRPGGAALMFAVGFNAHVIKRRGGWLSPNYHTYMRRGSHSIQHWP